MRICLGIYVENDDNDSVVKNDGNVFNDDASKIYKRDTQTN